MISVLVWDGDQCVGVLISMLVWNGDQCVGVGW